MLAKLSGTERKRKRDDDDEDVDMDGEDSDAADGEGWMDVDGEEAPKKRVKTSDATAVVDRRAPKTDRRFAGMRTEEVRNSMLPVEHFY